MNTDSEDDQNDPDYDYNQCINNLNEPYPHELNYITNYLDDYFPWMDDYRTKYEDIKDRFFFKRAPVNRPYSHTGEVIIQQIMQNSANM